MALVPARARRASRVSLRSRKHKLVSRLAPGFVKCEKNDIYDISLPLGPSRHANGMSCPIRTPGRSCPDFSRRGHLLLGTRCTHYYLVPTESHLVWSPSGPRLNTHTLTSHLSQVMRPVTLYPSILTSSEGVFISSTSNPLFDVSFSSPTGDFFDFSASVVLLESPAYFQKPPRNLTTTPRWLLSL